jgi:nucleoside 2-deoxyribosyltransferase
MEWVRQRIESAALVVADLTTANPNVYLEVGYAWGRGLPTVLLCKDTADLKFDVRGQRCLIYKSIRQLEVSLTRELTTLLKR